MSELNDAQLDKALAALPRDIELNSDLWPKIHAQIHTESHASITYWTSRRVLSQLAAGIILVVLSSFVTYKATHQSVEKISTQAARNIEDAVDVVTLPASFDGYELDAGYMQARADLDRLFAERIASLPTATRIKLLNNLAELRRAADEITAILVQHPSDPLLQELLISTRQRELKLFADVSHLNIVDSQRTAS